MAKKGFFDDFFKNANSAEKEAVVTSTVLKLFGNNNIIKIQHERDMHTRYGFKCSYGEKKINDSYRFYIWYKKNYFISITCATQKIEIVRWGESPYGIQTYDYYRQSDSSSVKLKSEIFETENSIIPTIQRFIRNLASLK
jgi:hypothetical protein